MSYHNSSSIQLFKLYHKLFNSTFLKACILVYFSLIFDSACSLRKRDIQLLLYSGDLGQMRMGKCALNHSASQETELRRGRVRLEIISLFQAGKHRSEHRGVREEMSQER